MKRHDVGAGQRVVRVMNTQTGRQELVIVDPNAPEYLPQTRAVAPYRQDFAPQDRDPRQQYWDEGAGRRGNNYPGRNSSFVKRLFGFVLFAAAAPAVHYGAEVGAYKAGATVICWAKQDSLANMAINVVLPESDVLCAPQAEPTHGISSVVAPDFSVAYAPETAVQQRAAESEGM